MRSAALLVIIGLVGCDSAHVGRSCTEIGCSDSLSLSLHTADNHWADGDYRIELELGDEHVECTFNLPTALPATTGSVGPISCGSTVRADFFAKSICTETRTRDAVSQSCRPLPDEWELQLNSFGTPASIKVRVTHDDQEVASLSQTVHYEENRPNGPDCEPLCRQAHIEVRLD